MPAAPQAAAAAAYTTTGASMQAAPAAAQSAAPVPAKKELPPLLRARLAKRGILPRVPFSLPPVSAPAMRQLQVQG